MLSYMLPTGNKPPPGEQSQNYNRTNRNDHHHQQQQQITRNSTPRRNVIDGITNSRNMTATTQATFAIGATSPTSMIANDIGESTRYRTNDLGHDSPNKHHNGNGIVDASMTTTTTTTTAAARKSTLHTSSRVTKDDSLHSIDSEASTVGSDRKGKIINGVKHASLKRVSFGSSKGSMVETLVYETPVQEEPENNHFMDHNGRLPAPMIPVPDTDEGREKVRVAFLGPTPSPATPGVLLLEPLLPNSGHLMDGMSASPAELVTAHTEHTSPAYHAQISTDSGWDNPFRPDGDLSREADEIVELIKGGKPITPTPGQNPPSLPGCEAIDNKINDSDNHDSCTRPLLDATSKTTNRQSSIDAGRHNNNQGNGNAHVGGPGKGESVNSSSKQQQQTVNEKIGQSANTATVEVGRVTAQGPGDASQVEHVTLKKKPKCKCCVLQ